MAWEKEPATRYHGTEVPEELPHEVMLALRDKEKASVPGLMFGAFLAILAYLTFATHLDTEPMCLSYVPSKSIFSLRGGGGVAFVLASVVIGWRSLPHFKIRSKPGWIKRLFGKS